jgi:hypothetical protein
MNGAVLFLIATTAAPSTCADEVRAAAIASRLSELPREVRDDLMLLTEGAMADSDSPLLQTDAPTAAERGQGTVRFAQGLLVGGKWFAQFEVSMFAGVRTVAYVRNQDGRFRRSPMHYFGGPACASIRAALDGVTTPGGF